MLLEKEEKSTKKERNKNKVLFLKKKHPLLINTILNTDSSKY